MAPHAAVEALVETVRRASVVEPEQVPGEIMLAIRPLLSGAAWDATCEALDLCEIHYCDAAICRDDNAACPAGWADAPEAAS